MQSDCECTMGQKVQKWEFSHWFFLRCDVARLHDRHQWQHDNQQWLPHRAHQHEHVSALFFLSFRAPSHCTLHRLTQVRAVSVNYSHRHAFMMCAVLTSRTSCRTFSTSLKTVASKCKPSKSVWTLLTSSTPSQVMSPTPTTSRRLTSSPTQSSWPHRRSPSKVFPRTPKTMTSHSWICCVKLTKYMSITLNEKTCLSVSRRRLCPKKRDDLLEKKRDGLLSQIVRVHRLELCWTIKKERIIVECQAGINKLQVRVDYDTKIWWNSWISAKRTSLRSSWRTSTTRSTISSWTVIAAIFGITWSSSKNLLWNGKVKEVPEFHLRHYCKRKVSRGQEHYFGIIKQSTGTAKRSKLYDSKDFQDAESIRNGNSHVTSRRVSFPLHGILLECRVAEKGRQTFGTHMIYWETLSRCVISTAHPQELYQWSSTTKEPFHSTVEQRDEHRIKIKYASLVRQSEIHSTLVRKDFQRIMGQTNNDYRFRKCILTHSLNQVWWEIKFKTEVYACSKDPAVVSLWIKEMGLNKWLIFNVRVP